MALAFAAAPSHAQDPVKAAPHAFKEIVNDSEVRVLEFSSKPGQKEGMHSYATILNGSEIAPYRSEASEV